MTFTNTKKAAVKTAKDVKDLVVSVLSLPFDILSIPMSIGKDIGDHAKTVAQARREAKASKAAETPAK